MITPAPWHIASRWECGWYRLIGAATHPVVRLMRCDPRWDRETKRYTHANPNLEADVTLMLAAPDLLAALEGCEAVMSRLELDDELGGMPSPELDAARLAIAKARGV